MTKEEKLERAYHRAEKKLEEELPVLWDLPPVNRTEESDDFLKELGII